MIGLSSLWRNAASYADGLRWTADLRHQDLAPRDRLWLHIVEADLGLGSGSPRLMADAAAAAAELSTSVEDPAADVIVRIYRSLSLSSHPDRAVVGLEAARDEARDTGELELHRLARAFRVVALLTAGRRTGLQAEISELTTAAATGYDRYICIWAAWADALADRDGPALRRWMDRQADSLRSSGLRENWVTLFCHALARIADGADYLPHLSQARRRAEAEGRRADPDCVLALAYAAACRGEPILAAELVGASGGVLFHDTANFLHHMIIRDHVVRPMLDATSFQEAIARGRERPVAAILSGRTFAGTVGLRVRPDFLSDCVRSWAFTTTQVPSQPVPSVLDMTVPQARSTLWAAGLQVTVIVEIDWACNTRRGRIMRQTPKAGTLVLPGSMVKIYAADHPPQCL